MKGLTCAGLMLVVLSGCNNSTGSSTAPPTNPAGNKNRELKVSVSKDVSVKQDHTDKFTVSVTRSHISGPVMIDVPTLPDGVTLETQDKTIPADKSSIDITIKASPTAKVMDGQHAMVTAKAMDDKDLAPASANFDISVKAK